MAHKVTELCFCLLIFTLVNTERSCPEKNPEKPELIPDRRDCTKFFICDNGLAFSQNCSSGLYFNPSLNVCDHPNNVVFCEYDDFVYLKPHCDCSKYVICNYGAIEVRECVHGYHYIKRSVQLYNHFDSDPCELGDC